MARPDIKVEVGFGAPSLQALSSVVWTDISPYVWLEQAPITITRGRSTELDRCDAGRMTLTLKNTDRRFDPESHYSPYAPYVKPRARIRVQARWPKTTGTWRSVYTGYVSTWKPLYLDGRQAACQVTALDAFSLFARRQVSLIISLAPGEAPASAMQNVLNVLGWPVADRSFSTPTGTILPQTTFTNAFVLDTGPYVSAWRLPGQPPTEAEIPTLAAQYDTAEAQAQADAQALRQRIRTLLQSAVGKSIDPQAANALTAAERNAINAARWFMEGIITKDGLIRPLSEWFEL